MTWPRSMPGLIELADVHQQVDARDGQLAGEAVDQHLAARDAVGVVEERRAAAGLAVEVDAGRGVEAALAEVDALLVGLAADVLERDRARAGARRRRRGRPRSGCARARRPAPSSGRASIAAATSASRARMRRHASAAAAPFRSVPLDAAVGEVLLFLSVLVGATITRVVRARPARRRRSAARACSRPGPSRWRRC